jgi:hypothetical protein
MEAYLRLKDPFLYQREQAEIKAWRPYIASVLNPAPAS